MSCTVARACAANGCRNPGRSLCARCKCVRFCSRDCQVAHWPVHKRECKLMARFRAGEQVKLCRLTEDDANRAVLPENSGAGAGAGAGGGVDMALFREALAGEVRPPDSWTGDGRVRVRVRFAYKDNPPLDVAVEPRHLAIIGGEVHDDASCWVCMEGAEAGRLRQGCACRGSAHAVHLPCIAKVAATRQERLGCDGARGLPSPDALDGWWSCPTCKQEWLGSLGLDLARAFVERNRAAGHPRAVALYSDMIANTVLAKLLSAGRRHAEAEECLRFNLDLLLKTAGPNDKGVLDIKLHLASIAQRVGDIPGAVQQYRELVKDNTRVVGADDTSTMLAASNLGICLQLLETQEGAEEALALFRDTHARQARVLGEQHGDTLATATSLAAAICDVQSVNGCADTDAIQEALAILNKTLTFQRRTFGPDHPDTLHTEVLRACLCVCGWLGACCAAHTTRGHVGGGGLCTHTASVWCCR